jgi:hypothetical protein
MTYQVAAMTVFLAILFAAGVGLIADAGRRLMAGERR